MALLKIARKGNRKSDIGIGLDTKQVEVLNNDELGISEAAAFRIIDLVKEKFKMTPYLRVAIRGGGCSGLTIHYEFIDQLRDNDFLFKRSEANVVIDKKSLSILGGATLHCRDYLGSKEFLLLNNPAAKLCSCGKSFTT
jgi:iron-sulfur cluster assembly protein